MSDKQAAGEATGVTIDWHRDIFNVLLLWAKNKAWWSSSFRIRTTDGEHQASERETLGMQLLLLLRSRQRPAHHPRHVQPPQDWDRLSVLREKVHPEAEPEDAHQKEAWSFSQGGGHQSHGSGQGLALLIFPIIFPGAAVRANICLKRNQNKRLKQ